MSPTRKARFKRRFVGVRPWMRHSLVLMVAGIVYTTIGVSYILAEPNPSRERSLVVALDKLPFEAWGGIFIFCGALAVLSSRWPPVAETWGYMVLTGLSAGWSATYATGVIFKHTGWTNMSGALLWGLMGFMWWAVSGLVNPGQAIVIVEPHQLDKDLVVIDDDDEEGGATVNEDGRR